MFINKEPKPKGQYSVMFINIENQLKEQSSLVFINKLPKIRQKFQIRGTSLKPTNILIAAGAITKNNALDMKFHKPSGQGNPYVRFEYGLLKNCIHTRGQF